MPREERERRYIAEYMATYFPAGGYSLNVPLGPIPEDIVARYGVTAGAALWRPARLRVDAVAWQPNVYWLIEAKVRAPRDAIGSLSVYLDLAPRTPDLPNYEGQEIRGRLVVPWALDWIRDLARERGLDLVEFLPAWVEAYVRSIQDYFTRDARIAREEKLRLRQLYGLD